jgi:hypothetical protein
MASAGPSDFRHQLRRTETHLCISENQASRGPSGIASVSAGNGTAEILQGQWHCVLGFCAIGSRDEAGIARRSSDFGDRRASGKDAGTGAAGLGGAARHGFADHAEDCGSREREFRHLPSSTRRTRRNQSHSNQTAIEFSREYRRSGFHSKRRMNVQTKPQLEWSDRVRRQ